MNTNNPFLYFNYTLHDGSYKPMQFINPIKIYETYNIQEIIPYLNLIQQDITNGFYAAGYLSYESAPAFNKKLQTNNNNEMPLLWFGIFNEPLTEAILHNNHHTFTFTDWKPSVSLDKYYKNIDKIQDYIKNNQTRQVNYTIHLKSKFSGDSFAYYRQLERAQAARYSAYLNIDQFSILSASPELFFHLKDGVITTKPMKGTIHRGKTYKEDIKHANWLQSSAKNRHENKLITHLMTSELDKIAEVGTVEASKLFEIEKYPTVYQMTSTVQAKLASNKDIIDIFKALFPCGSITGTPKKETMDIIRHLEEETREVYCGAIGYLTPNEEAFFNVPIRTVVINNKNGHAQYGVGGAITINSIKPEEYKEILTKGKLLTQQHPTFQLLETIGLVNGKYIVLKNHIERLNQSAKYFDYEIDIPLIQEELKKIAKKYNQKKWKVRLLVDKKGDYTIEIEEIIQNPNKVTVALADKPISKSNVFMYHKTTYRDMYKEHEKKDQNIFDVLLWNVNREVTEFTMGNIVVEREGKLVTPPVECGLLPGTFREKLLQDGIIKEAKVTIEEIQQCHNIWLINSVREWIPVDLMK